MARTADDIMARKTPEIIELDAKEFEKLLERAKSESFDANDYQTIGTLVESYAHLIDLLHNKNTSLARLRKLLFGASTEKTDAVVGAADEVPSEDAAQDNLPESTSNLSEDDQRDMDPPKKKVKGHGRNGANAYTGGEKVNVPHESLQAGDNCPECVDGTLYQLSSAGVLVRITGRAPLYATVYELAKLRCNLCNEVFTAQAPEGVGNEKYDEAAAAMIGILKYGSGLPFNRIDRLQQNLEIPLPSSTQWEVVSGAAPLIDPAYRELMRQAAQGELLQNDDTTVKILEWMGQRGRRRTSEEGLAERPRNQDGSPRTGLYTTGIVSTRNGQRIALFFSGHQHAGENLMDVLGQRAQELEPPIQMCDALSRNLPDELATIVANCLAHARRNFVDVYDRFPEPCRQVLEALKIVYKTDADARKQELSPEERLALHQAESGPVMKELQEWLKKQFDDHFVEPNSSLGQAISYMLNHWDKLTLFLRKAGAPLDNNVCERALKKAILHRKNALFFKTQRGARVGDLYMSLIYTCELCEANPFDYLTELQQNANEVAAHPELWMPWNYRQTLDATHAAA